MLIPSNPPLAIVTEPSLSRRVNANSQPVMSSPRVTVKLIKKGEC